MNIAYSFKFALEAQTPVVPTEVKYGVAYFPGAVSVQRLSDGERQHIESRLRYQRAYDSVGIISNGKPVTDGIDLKKTPVLAGVIDKMAHLVGVLHAPFLHGISPPDQASLSVVCTWTPGSGAFNLFRGKTRPLAESLPSLRGVKAVDGGEAFQVTTTDRVPPRTINARVRQSGDFTDGASLFRAPPEEQASASHRLGKGRNPNGGRKLLPRRNGLTAEEWENPSTEEQATKKQSRIGNNSRAGAAASGKDCNQVGAGPNESKAAKKRKGIPVHAGDEGAEEAPGHLTLGKGTWEEDENGNLVLGYHNTNDREGKTPRCYANTIPVTMVGKEWRVPERALRYIRAGKRYYDAAAKAPRPEYRWCGVEQVDEAGPISTRSNGWRYLGPRVGGETIRRQAVFGAGFRLRLPFPRLSSGPGHNSHPLGGDPDLPDFQAWARTMLLWRVVHRDDADAWRAAFVDVAGDGHGQLVVSTADETWRVILCWGSRGRRIDVNQHGIPTSLVDLQVRAGVISEDPRFRQLNIACFGHRLVWYDPLTEFGFTWKERLPRACLAVLVADSWRDSQIDLLKRDRRRFGFRDVDPLTEDALGTTYGQGDWQCDINGAHTAAMLGMENLQAFTHVDEMQAFDGHDIEDWTLFVVRLDEGGDPDVFLNADVTPVFGQNYKRYLALVHTPAPHSVTHFVRPARTVQKCHIPGLVQDLLARDLGEPLLQVPEAARRFKKGLLVRTSGLLQQRQADKINAVMVTTSEDAMAVGGKIVPVLGEVNRLKSELRTSGTDGELGIEKLDSGDAYLCFEASRVWCRDGFWALRTLILDDTRQLFEGHGLGFGEWARVACGQSSPALRKKSATVTVKGAEDRRYRSWVS
eukprot:g14411.t1